MRTVKIILTILFIFILTNCDRFDEHDDINGVVKFNITSEFDNFGGPSDRIETSEWKHIFSENVRMNITNKNNDAKYYIDFNPNTETDISITIPYGDYIFEVNENSNSLAQNYLPFVYSGDFTLNSSILTINQNIETDYGLVTINHGFVDNVKLFIGDNEFNVTYVEELAHYYVYVKNNTNIKLHITENVRNTTLIKELTVLSNKHYNYVLRIITGSVSFIDLLLEPFEYIEYVVPIGALDFKVGDTVRIEAIPNFGWEFSYWEINNEMWSDTNKDLVYIMPNMDVSIVAHFKK